MHEDGCGEPALVVLKMPTAHAEIQSKHFEHIDGPETKLWIVPECGTCGAKLRRMIVDHIKPEKLNE